MTVIETPTRAQVAAERDQLIEALNLRYGTTDRSELRDLSVSGEMARDDVLRVDRLSDLDFLLGEK